MHQGAVLAPTTAIAQLAPGLETRNLLFTRDLRRVYGDRLHSIRAGQVRCGV
jgi:hypothetical protein